MESYFQSALDALLLVLSWPNLAYVVAGTLLAMLFSFVPGIGGLALMAFAIPLTMTWDIVPLILFFGALLGGATFMGSMTAILLNVPGSPPNAATMLDGYPLAKQGKARTAIAGSATSSALGSSFGVLVLLALIPVMRRMILAFGAPELLMLAIWGLTTVAAIQRSSMLKGIAIAGLGLLVSFIGMDPRTAEPRFTADIFFLYDGVSIVPVALGLFAVAEMIHLAVSQRRSISGRRRIEELGGSVREGIMSVFRNFWLFLRCSVIGTVIGMIPGIGGVVAAHIAYGHAAQSSSGDPDAKFGSGDIRGVIAPESANDAKDGGSLVPLTAFGVPGDVGTALLLVVFMLHGIVPGKELITTHIDLVFILIWALFLANWLTSLLGMAAINPLVRITLVPTHILVPVVLALAALGAYAYRSSAGDVAVAFVFGIAGYYMKKYDWPRVAFVIAFVLGPMVEDNLLVTLTLQEMGRINIWTRPIAMVLLALAVVSLLAPWRRRRGRNR